MNSLGQQVFFKLSLTVYDIHEVLVGLSDSGLIAHKKIETGAINSLTALSIGCF